MNLSLAKEIYSITPWCVDQASFPALMAILENAKLGVNLEIPEEKYNSISILDLSSKETRLITETYQLRSDNDFNGIGVIKLDGVITVSGGASSYGMDYLSSQMKRMAQDSRIKSFIILGNSGGGSSMAVEMMSKTITEVRQTKRVIGLVKEGGMMASACFGIMSACESIYAESEMSIVGSAGTMMQFEGREANSKHNGVKYIRLYAPESDNKNKGFEEAINKDNYTILIDQLLKPMNDRFLSLIESNRPQIKGTDFRNGHTVFAKDAVGTFIDGIKSLSEIVQILSESKAPESKVKNKNENDLDNKSNININNNNKMTKAEFKAANPDAYNEIVAEGIAQRTDQVGAWMAHVNTDAEAVVAGINSGNNITQSEREGFFVKQNAQKSAKSMIDESAEDAVSSESDTDPKKVINKENEKEVEAAFEFELK